ncbi:hypothetical protein BVRB_9g218930 [Beta vulgaris subsp. vulgaris]|nr:hypothetical protein BVRB_9g218930 [Beta vulgaris subsp. vulgaris]
MATAVGLVLTVTQTLLSAMQTKDLRDVCFMFGYETKLEELKHTVKTIQAVLHDADSKQQELSTLGKNWIEKLKDAVYDADDLFDEFNITLQRKRMSGDKISRKVRYFLSVDNQLFFAAKISRKITKIRVKLDRIVKDHHDFGFSISNTVTDVRKPKREETSSYVYELTMFVLGGRSSNQMQIGQLRDLIPLVNLRGELKILFKKCYPYDLVNVEEGLHLSNKKCIKCLKLEEEFESDLELSCPKGAVIIDKRLLESLEPHRDIREINIKGYKDLRLPSWATTLASSFPLLVKIDLRYFNELEHMPQLSQLKHLRTLNLLGMLNVEYMEDDNNGAILPFYPSLEELCLIDFPNLKGWWREVGVEREAVLYGVLTLKIIKCPNLTSFPGCPKLKVVELQKFNDALTFCAGPNPSTSSDGLVYCLDTLTIDNVGPLNSLFGETLQGICELVIKSSEVQNLSTIAEWYLKHASSIKCLKFVDCNNLMSLSVLGIEHMTNLERLCVTSCEKLDLEGDDDGMPWRALSNLSYLNLRELPKVVNLPKGIQYLYSLKTLFICQCNSLDNLPEWLHRLTSLQCLDLHCCPRLKSLPKAGLPNLTSLQIINCSCELVKRCRKPDGEDWPKISHIPIFNCK